MRIYKKGKLTEEKNLPILSKNLKFFHECSYFLGGQCSSTNWSESSPCWDCYKKGEYIIRINKKEK